MQHRDATILAEKDLGAVGTETIDINIASPLSTIELVWRTKVVTVSDMTDTHPACISRVELVDGSDVLTSLSGEQIQALAMYTQGVLPHNNLTVVVDDYMESVLPIFFGRYLFDKEFAFDPTKFKNPQLKVTWDEDVANGSVVINGLTVRATVFDKASVSPRGFFMAKEIKTYTPVAAAHEYTDLPTDYPYRMIMLRHKSTDTEPCSVLAQAKLSEDNDKRVCFDLTGDEIFWKYCAPLGRIVEKIRLNETAGDAMALYPAPSYLQGAAVDYDEDVIAAGDESVQVGFANNIMTIPLTVNFVPYIATLTGYVPYSYLAVPLCDLKSSDDIYDIVGVGSLRFTTKGGAAVGTSPSAAIVIQQLRT